MFSARYQADAPVEVDIRDESGFIEIPSAQQILHVGISICNLRLLGRAISEALNEHDVSQRNIVPLRRGPGKG